MKTEQQIRDMIHSRTYIQTAKPGRIVYRKPHPNMPLAWFIEGLEWALNNYNEDKKISLYLESLRQSENASRWHTRENGIIGALEWVLD